MTSEMRQRTKNDSDDDDVRGIIVTEEDALKVDGDFYEVSD